MEIKLVPISVKELFKQYEDRGDDHFLIKNSLN